MTGAGGADIPWPHNLPSRLPIHRIAKGRLLTRIHREPPAGGREPFFGAVSGEPPDARFHDPLGEFRVCFLGVDATASFAEVFLRDPPARLVTVAELEGRYVSTLRTTRRLRLARLFGDGLARLGTTASITSSLPPYDEPRALAHAIWEHRERVDGIAYRCRHDNNRFAIALFDRSRSGVQLTQTEALLADKPRLLEWSRGYGFDIG